MGNFGGFTHFLALLCTHPVAAHFSDGDRGSQKWSEESEGTSSSAESERVSVSVCRSNDKQDLLGVYYRLIVV